MLYDLSRKICVTEYVPPVIDKRKNYKILLQDDFQIRVVYENLINRGYLDSFHISSVIGTGKPVGFFLTVYNGRAIFARFVDPVDFHDHTNYEEIDWFKLIKDGVHSV